MPEEDTKQQTSIQEGQPVPRMQRILTGQTVEKGQPVPPMQVRPQSDPLPQTGNTDTSDAGQ